MSDSNTTERRQTGRCPICDWPTYVHEWEVCTQGSCSYRPHEGTAEYRRIHERREALKESVANGQ
jgi:hypothetical protein